MGTKKLSDYMTGKALTDGSVGHAIGDLKHNPRYIPTSADHPWKNLADVDEELDIANYPDYVPVMQYTEICRDIFGSSIRDSFYVVSEEIVSNIATLHFSTYSGQVECLNSLAEMLLDYTSGVTPTPTDYTNWNMCLTHTIPLGSIPAGDHTITNINPSAHTISFVYVAPNESNVINKYAVRFHPYRVPGDLTKCRHRQRQGKSIMTPDFETFFNGVSGRDNEIDNRGNDKGYFGAFLYQYVGRYIA